MYFSDIELILIDEENMFVERTGYLISKDKAREILSKLEHYIENVDVDSVNEEIEYEREMRHKLEAERRKKEPPKKKENNGYIYFVESEHGGVKIGKTKNFKTRIKALRSASPFKLKVLKIIEGPNIDAYELYVHEHFKEKRLEGEWFDITLEDINSFMLKEGIISE